MKNLSIRLNRLIDALTMGRLVGVLMAIMGIVLAERPLDGAATMLRRVIIIGPQSYALVLCFFGAILFIAQPHRRNAWFSLPLIGYLIAEMLYALSPDTREPLMNAVLYWAFYALMLRLWTMPPYAGRDIMTLRQSDLESKAGADVPTTNT